MSTGVGVVIFLEAVALIVWVILALGYDQKIKAWEDRTSRRIRRWLRERVGRRAMNNEYNGVRRIW